MAVLFWVTLLACLYTCHSYTLHAQDTCEHNGLLLRNGTVWKSAPCSECQCLSSVTVCQKLQCFIPKCPSGTVLSSHPQECCPRCMPEMMPCYEGTSQIDHGVMWSPSPCMECQCYNGTINCGRKQCQLTGCPEDQVAVQTPEECCPKCIATGRYCRHGSELYEDGTKWYPTPCSACKCQNGRILCYVEQCSPLTCPSNFTLQIAEGECCPKCKAIDCMFKGKLHQSGDQWSESACVSCTCLAGEVKCHNMECNARKCQAGEKEYLETGQCCPICVKDSGWCLSKNGEEIPSGFKLTTPLSKCDSQKPEVCFCFKGSILCNPVTCRNENCYPGQKLLEPSPHNGCKNCPICVPDFRDCYYDGVRRKDGDVWDVGCHICSCKKGQIGCYAPSCPACAPGSSSSGGGRLSLTDSSISPSPSSSCCPKCLPSKCPNRCVSCLPGIDRQSLDGSVASSSSSSSLSFSNDSRITFVEPAGSHPTGEVCTECRRGFYLDEGRCVNVCTRGKFAKHGRCYLCHSSCATCSDRTKFHCTSCPSPSVLQKGTCVAHCGGGHYLLDGECQGCHASCQECTGGTASDCQLCPGDAKLLQGKCLPTCPDGFIARKGVCQECPNNCLHCGVKECLQCQDNWWHQDGSCVKECNDGYYKTSRNRCLSCHPSCRTCNGPGSTSCTSCPKYLQQLGSSCLTTCPPGTFSTQNKCHECHSSCSECMHEGSDGCLECKYSANLVLPQVQNKAQTTMHTKGEAVRQIVGRCVDMCPEGFQIWKHACIAPPSDECLSWHPSNPRQCLECPKGKVLQNGSCKSACTSGFFEIDESCFQCDPHCASCIGPGLQRCETCPEWASFHQKAMKGQVGTSSKCLTKCRDRFYFQPKDSSCRMCDSSCEQCALRTRNGPPVCSKCKNPDHVIQGSKCVAKCREGTFLQPNLNECLPCHSSCSSCSGPAVNQCLSCPGKKFNKDGLCLADRCPRDSFLSPSGDCQKCDPQCYKCVDSKTCLACPPKKHLLYGKCVDKCPEMFFVDHSKNGSCQECHWACDQCSGPTHQDCIRCGLARLREAGSCVDRCSDGFYKEKGECLPCPGGCKKCHLDRACTECQIPYFKQNSNCVAECKNGTYSNEFEKACVDCDPNCEKCSMFECQVCKDPFLLQNGQCVTECDSDYLVDEENLICFYNVNGPVLFIPRVLVAEVGDLSLLNFSLFNIFDSDTPKEQLYLEALNLPQSGFLVIANDTNSEVILKEKQQIQLSHLEEGRVFFKPSGSVMSQDEIKFRAGDGKYHSDVAVLPISLVSLYPPEIRVLEPIIVRKSGKSVITEDNLLVSDLDNFDDVTIQILSKPKSGKFIQGGQNVSSFTARNLEEMLVNFESISDPESEATPAPNFNVNQESELIVLQANDGFNFINALIEIIVVDSTDPAPVLIKNKGAKVNWNDRIKLTPDLLQAKDIDSNDENVIFSVIPSLQNDGRLVLVIPKPSMPSSMLYDDGWVQMDESHLLRPTSSFTQRDINEGRVWYVHSPPANQNASERTADTYSSFASDDNSSSHQLVFSVSDSSQPPNILGDQAFIIEVSPPLQEFEQLGSPSSSSEMGLTVYEGQAATITPDHLSFSGVDSSAHLLYTITSPLGPLDGSLFHIESPGLELSQFTQSDIDDMMIVYMPPLENVKDRKISFKFKITQELNGQTKDFGEHKFLINVLSLKKSDLQFSHPDPEILVSSLGTVELQSKYFELDNLPQEEVKIYLLENPSAGSVIVFPEGKEAQPFTEDSEYSFSELMKSKVVYSNDGSISSSDSMHVLALSRSAEATTRIQFKIRFDDKPLLQVKKENGSFSLDLDEGEIEVITEEILHFDDLQSSNTDLIYTLISQPQLGSLLLEDSKGQDSILNQTNKFTQADVWQGLLSYHSSVEIGMDPAQELIQFNVTDRINNVAAKKLLKVTIHPVDNKAPRLEINEIISVEEGQQTRISPSLFMASDADTPASRIILKLDVPPLFGFIANAENAKSEASRVNSISFQEMEFPLLNFLEGKMIYVQSQHKHQEPLQDSFMAHISDGANESPVRKITINISPMDDEAPVVLGEQVSVQRGATVVITNSSVFIADADSTPKNLKIQIIQTPKQGSLHKRKSVESSIKESVDINRGDSFVFQDILQQLVFYSHDGSAKTRDTMEIMVSDGHQETGAIVEFLIQQPNHLMPRLITNEEMMLVRGQESLLTPDHLSARDEDSLNEFLVYLITLPVEEGILLRREPQNSDSWSALVLGTKFSQYEINLGNIKYSSYPGNANASVDGFSFNLQDPDGNTLLDQRFKISILEDKNTPKILVNEGITLEENSYALITSKVLMADDKEVSPKNLIYKLLSDPKHGHLENTDNPAIAVKEWSQDDLNQNHLKYTIKDVTENQQEELKFSLTDGKHMVNGSFKIEIQAVDKTPPELFLQPLKVQEGIRKIISHYELNVIDPDTEDHLVTFHIRKKPKHGKLQIFRNGKHHNTKTFTMADIYSESVSYNPGKSSYKADSFTLKVSDSHQEEYIYKGSSTIRPTTVPVEINVVVGDQPVLMANRGFKYLNQVDQKALRYITRDELRSQSKISTAEELLYKVVIPPRHGVLRLETRERPILQFTQDMIDKGLLYYELTSFDNAIVDDEFTFNISNKNSPDGTTDTFHIEWTWTAMSKSEYYINENQRVLQISIKRKGHLKHKSSAVCHIESPTSSFAYQERTNGTTQANSEDFIPIHLVANFSSGTRERHCEIAINNDDIREGDESFKVFIAKTDKSLIGLQKETKVTISDDEDQTTFEFESSRYSFTEKEEKLYIPVRRKGDLNSSASILCITKDKTAFGEVQQRNGIDFIRRPLEESSRIVFPPAVEISSCEVELVDDRYFEKDEEFELILTNPSKGSIIGKKNVTTIKIQGQNDQSLVRVKELQIEAYEDSGRVEIFLERVGPDLKHSASVWVASRIFTPKEAVPVADFIPFSKQLNFHENQSEVSFFIDIVDDVMTPIYEGPEKFIVFLSTPENASLDDDKIQTLITIKDDEDIPSVEFANSEIKVKENDGVFDVPLIRSGDVTGESILRCFTRQRSAKAGIDFRERPNIPESDVLFPPGSRRSTCHIAILDDPNYEKKEEFALRLTNTDSNLAIYPKIGKNKVARIAIIDPEDKPRIVFEKATYNFEKPRNGKRLSVVKISVLRIGDKSRTSRVRITAKNGSALSGKDFRLLGRIFEFHKGVERMNLNISILDGPNDGLRSKSFTIVIGSEKTDPNQIGYTNASVNIFGRSFSESSVLPYPPLVISLLHYDNAQAHLGESASPGYPLICVSSCEEKHPNYQAIKNLCKEPNLLEQSKIKYYWEVAAPEENKEDNPVTSFYRLTEPSLFGGVNSKVLDSMYFARQFKVRCIAQPVLEDDQYGTPLQSEPIVIGSDFGICHKAKKRLHNQSFMAKLSYINFTDEIHPNTIEISVEIPHQDGMVPLVSTLPLNNIKYVLTDEIYRVHHTCSNLNLVDGFIHSAKNLSAVSRPYQWDKSLREAVTLTLYRHLDMPTCAWKFVSYYSMSQLVNKCGGQIASDFQIGSRGQSFLTVRLPLYLSYVFASPAPGWTSLDHRTEISVSLYYSTLLWNQGLHTEPSLTAKIQMMRVSLDNFGRLVVEFSTFAKFRGQFVVSHPSRPGLLSQLMAPKSLNIVMKLELLWSAATWDGPEQAWRATSDYTLKDYTGNYSLHLIPCTVLSAQSYSRHTTAACNPEIPANFTLPLSIQQAQRPVPLVYTLNTNFQILRTPFQFIMDPERTNSVQELDYKGSFGPGQVVYGRVLWHPDQNLHSAYELVIQKVFLCTGADGYVPKYDPTGKIYREGPQYGCILPTEKLLHHYLILDRERQHFADNNITVSPIEAYFASDHSDYRILNSYPGMDGFLLMTDGLFKIGSGQQWFLQVLYTIGPRKFRHIHERIVRSSIIQDFAKRDSNSKRSPLIREMDNPLTPEDLKGPEFLQDLHTRNGTNLRGFNVSDSFQQNSEYSSTSNIIYITLSILFILLVTGVVYAFVKRKWSGESNIVVVRSRKNEMAQARNLVDIRSSEKYPRTLVSPVTLNSESNLHTIKVKTLAVTVRNNLEDGTEV